MARENLIGGFESIIGAKIREPVHHAITRGLNNLQTSDEELYRPLAWMYLKRPDNFGVFKAGLFAVITAAEWTADAILPKNQFGGTIKEFVEMVLGDLPSILEEYFEQKKDYKFPDSYTGPRAEDVRKITKRLRQHFRKSAFNGVMEHLSEFAKDPVWQGRGAKFLKNLAKSGPNTTTQFMMLWSCMTKKERTIAASQLNRLDEPGELASFQQLTPGWQLYYLVKLCPEVTAFRLLPPGFWKAIEHDMRGFEQVFAQHIPPMVTAVNAATSENIARHYAGCDFSIWQLITHPWRINQLPEYDARRRDWRVQLISRVYLPAVVIIIALVMWALSGWLTNMPPPKMEPTKSPAVQEDTLGVQDSSEVRHG